MRTKKSIKILMLALTVIMVFGVCSTAMAYYHTYSNLSGIVQGGASQRMVYATRQYASPSFKLDAAYNTGNPGIWRMRGYNASTNIHGMEVTALVSLDKGGITYDIPFIKIPNNSMSMYQSVDSSSTSDYFTFSVTLKF